MARPRTPIGSYGVIHEAEIAPGVWRARTLYRFQDGKRRQVERTRAGKTAAKAVTALKEALTKIVTPGSGAITGQTKLSVLADEFLTVKAGRAARTVDTYRYQLDNHIKPRIGDLTITEATTKKLQTFITAVTKEHGPGAAKGCRSVLSGMFGIAVREDAIRTNPVAGVENISRGESKGAIALPLEDVTRFREAIRGDEELARLDIVDLMEFMLFVGCRVGEALALRWSHVDLAKGTITLSATVSRARGEGLILQEHGKTASSTRTITVPEEALAILRSRSDNGNELVFPSMLGKLRDGNNTERDWRLHRERLGFPKVTSHSFRKTVATALDQAGMSARAIAEYLGHKQPSMTQDVYMSRNTGSADAAARLTRIYGVSSGSEAA